MQFSDRLTEMMEHRGVSTYRVSKDLGISDSQVGYWKRGMSEPSLENIQKLADYFQVSTDYLLCKTEDPTPSSNSKKEEETALLRDALQGSAYMDMIKDMNREERREFANKFVKFVNDNRYTLELIRDTIDQPDSEDN